MFQGGAQPFFNDAVAGTVVDVKTTAGWLLGLSLVNTTGDDAYLQVFNKPAADVVIGTTAAAFCLRVPAGAGAAMSVPLELGGTGISIAGTTTATGSTGAAISTTAFYG